MTNFLTNRSIGVFQYRDYRLLWASFMSGTIVVWMRILGTAQWLLDETGSAYLVGLIGVVQLFVQFPMVRWAGTLADRVDRKKLMTLAHGLTGVISFFRSTHNTSTPCPARPSSLPSPSLW